MAHELAAGLDQRARALGERLAASPEPWLANQLGVLAPHASPLLREDYARLAAAAAAYREAAGITDPGQAIAPEPHRGNPELDAMRQAAIRALEVRDEAEIVRGMTHGELEARILDGNRAQASAPPDVSRDLRLTAQAEADAWQQSADAEIRHDQTGSANAKALARHMAAQREQLEAANARYEKWAADTGSRREAAGKAMAEAVHRIAADNAAREARAQYTARLEREAHAQAEPAAQRRCRSTQTRPKMGCLIADHSDGIVALLVRPSGEGSSCRSRQCVKGRRRVNYRWFPFRTESLPCRLRCWLSAPGSSPRVGEDPLPQRGRRVARVEGHLPHQQMPQSMDEKQPRCRLFGNPLGVEATGQAAPKGTGACPHWL